MIMNFLKLFTKKRKLPLGLHVGAIPNVVVIYHDGKVIRLTPDLARQLAISLPRFADLATAIRSVDVK